MKSLENKNGPSEIVFPIVLFFQSLSQQQLNTESMKYWSGTSLYCKIENSSIFRPKIRDLYFSEVNSQELVIMVPVRHINFCIQINSQKICCPFCPKIVCFVTLQTTKNWMSQNWANGLLRLWAQFLEFLESQQTQCKQHATFPDWNQVKYLNLDIFYVFKGRLTVFNLIILI